MTKTEKSSARIPLRHLSVRVPWHDSRWDGTVCRGPRRNSSCLALNRIGATKNEALEEQYKGQPLTTVPDEDAPACFAERVNFLSAKPQRRLARHAYSKTSEHHKHICDTPFMHPAYSAAATPFGWLLKKRAWGEKWAEGKIDSQSIVERYGIDSRPEYEPDEPDWLADRPWIQGYANQKALLDSFFDALKPKRSLMFVYAKRTPLIDDDQWMIVGAGQISSIGDIQEWDYDPPQHDRIRSYLWERSVCHNMFILISGHQARPPTAGRFFPRLRARPPAPSHSIGLFRPASGLKRARALSNRTSAMPRWQGRWAPTGSFTAIRS